MATKQMIALKDFRYGTRMMRAGDPVEMKAPDIRLYTALGAIRPRAERVAATPAPPVAPPPVAPTATAPKRKARRRKAATKK